MPATEGWDQDVIDEALQLAARWHLAGMSFLSSLGVAADELCLKMAERADE